MARGETADELEFYLAHTVLQMGLIKDVEQLFSTACFSTNDPSGEAPEGSGATIMWAHYANSFKGICQACANEHSLNEGLVNTYQNMAATKSSIWRYENEIRLIGMRIGSGYFRLPDYQLTVVTFGLRRPRETVLQVRSALGGGFDYYDLCLTQDSFGYQRRKRVFSECELAIVEMQSENVKRSRAYVIF